MNKARKTRVKTHVRKVHDGIAVKRLAEELSNISKTAQSEIAVGKSKDISDKKKLLSARLIDYQKKIKTTTKK